jgi:hypothetical protein
MPSECYSNKQVHCVDYGKIYRKIVYKTPAKVFQTVSDLAMLPLQTIVGFHIPVSAT